MPACYYAQRRKGTGGRPGELSDPPTARDVSSPATSRAGAASISPLPRPLRSLPVPIDDPPCRSPAPIWPGRSEFADAAALCDGQLEVPVVTPPLWHRSKPWLIVSGRPMRVSLAS